eukprot:scaffold92143_cov69-Phaeocystis_antarctica.AAC.2
MEEARAASACTSAMLICSPPFLPSCCHIRSYCRPSSSIAAAAGAPLRVERGFKTDEFLEALGEIGNHHCRSISLPSKGATSLGSRAAGGHDWRRRKQLQDCGPQPALLQLVGDVDVCSGE